MRSLPQTQIDFDDVVITYKTNAANQELTLTSADANDYNFYIGHTSHTNTNHKRILLRLTQNNTNTKLLTNRALISTTNSLLDGQLTLNIKFRTNPGNAANAGSYSSNLNVTWRSTS